ncbi:hypothetical protein LCGC14_2717680, partial [marine sediment metagenome]
AVPDQALALSQKHARLDALAREMDWSLLSLVSRGDTWFRDAEVITFFDALADGTLLDQFDTVLFYGAGSGGHAALSYALAAPFSRILAMSPLPSEGCDATTDRYAPAAENLAVAEHVFVPQDPAHADGTLGARNLMPLSCRHMGQKLEETLIDFGILDDVVCDAMDGVLTEAAFYRLLRARRDNTTYLRGLVARTIDADRPLLEALSVRNIAERLGRNRYARRFEKLREELAERGIAVPAGRRGDRP